MIPWLAAATHAAVAGASLIPKWRSPLIYSIGDAADYIRAAENFLLHRVFSQSSGAPYLWDHGRPPGYPLLLVLAKTLTSTYAIALFYPAITAFWAAHCAMRLLRQLELSERTATFAGLLVALLPCSLAYSGHLMPDAIFGHLFLVWLAYALQPSWGSGNRASTTVLVLIPCLTLLRPTFAAGVLLLLPTMWYARQVRRRLGFLLVATAISFVVPGLLTLKMRSDHGINTSSVLLVSNVRRCLEAQYLTERLHRPYSAVQDSITSADLLEAARQSGPISIEGRTYLVQLAHVRRFIRTEPWAAMRIACVEGLRQLAAPQTDGFRDVLWRRSSIPVRLAGSAVQVAFIGLAAVGCMWGPIRSARLLGIATVAAYLYFVGSGAICHQVGGRLRFPADMAAIPLAAIGLDTLARSLRPRSHHARP